LAIFLIATSIAMLTVSSASVASADKTDKNHADDGLNNADRKVHENTGSTPEEPSKQDLKFHEGTCQGGHTTDVLDSIGGCDILPEPGNSGDHP
jgi:hypothetical protein